MKFSEIINGRQYSAWHILITYFIHQRLRTVGPMSASAPSFYNFNKILISLLFEVLNKQNDNLGIVATLPILFKHIVLYSYHYPYLRYCFEECVGVCVRVHTHTVIPGRHSLVNSACEKKYLTSVNPSQLLFSLLPFTVVDN